MSNTTNNFTNRLSTAFLLLIAVIFFQNVTQENTAQELRITIAKQIIEEPGTSNQGNPQPLIPSKVNSTKQQLQYQQ